MCVFVYFLVVYICEYLYTYVHLYHSSSRILFYFKHVDMFAYHKVHTSCSIFKYMDMFAYHKVHTSSGNMKYNTVSQYITRFTYNWYIVKTDFSRTVSIIYYRYQKQLRVSGLDVDVSPSILCTFYPHSRTFTLCANSTLYIHFDIYI